jgi:ribonuclease HI
MTTIWIDGASRGNPGPSAIAWVRDDDKLWASKLKIEGSNNRAEYLALLEALRLAVVDKLEEVKILSDSKLVVDQINGDYACRDKTLRIYRNRALVYIRQIPKFSLNLIPRDENKRADKLANMALDGKL